jgi:hypothetical protein
MQLAILPHPRAPFFPHYYNPVDDTSSPPDLSLVAKAIEGILVAGNNKKPISGDVLEIIRQLSFVNLFFFEKFVLGCKDGGPYDKLTYDLHLDMCNWRQSHYCMDAGVKAAGFISRSFYKSTVWTHGADTWEILRNPNIRIRIVNAVAERAQSFMRSIKLNFEKNHFVRILFPEYCPSSRTERWNENEIVMPNRTKTYPEPTVKAVGVGGASAGDHHDIIDIDDIITVEDLNVNRTAGVGMERSKNWFKSNVIPLMISPQESRVIVKGTFYSIDDVYMTEIVPLCKTLRGFLDQDFIKPDPKGVWHLYYRDAVENDKAICSSIMSIENLAELAKSDFWTYQTQYRNNPQKSGLSEFSDCEIKLCYCEFDYKKHDYRLEVIEKDGKTKTYWLSKERSGIFIDPASTEKGITAKTSRSAIGVCVRTWDDERLLIWSKCGYYNTVQMFDHIFYAALKFKGYISAIWIENNGPQSAYIPLLEKERNERELYIPIRPAPAPRVDKMVRIRNNFGRELMKNKISATKECQLHLRDEIRAFGQTERVDFLDMFEKSIVHLPKAMSPDEREEKEWNDAVENIADTRNYVTGY